MFFITFSKDFLILFLNDFRLLLFICFKLLCYTSGWRLAMFDFSLVSASAIHSYCLLADFLAIFDFTFDCVVAFSPSFSKQPLYRLVCCGRSVLRCLFLSVALLKLQVICSCGCLKERGSGSICRWRWTRSWRIHWQWLSLWSAYSILSEETGWVYAKLTLSGFCYTYLDRCYVLQHVVHEPHTLFSEKL